jgi:hypothetical protein
VDAERPGGRADGTGERVGAAAGRLEALAAQEGRADDHAAGPRQRLGWDGDGIGLRQLDVRALARRAGGEDAAGEARRADAVACEAEREVDPPARPTRA